MTERSAKYADDFILAAGPEGAGLSATASAAPVAGAKSVADEKRIAEKDICLIQNGSSPSLNRSVKSWFPLRLTRD
jgi:hypothetical protein